MPESRLGPLVGAVGDRSSGQREVHACPGAIVHRGVRRVFDLACAWRDGLVNPFTLLALLMFLQCGINSVRVIAYAVRERRRRRA